MNKLCENYFTHSIGETGTALEGNIIRTDSRITKLEYAAFLKYLEGDTEYADALFNLFWVLGYGEGENSAESLKAHQDLKLLSDERLERLGMKYHSYATDMERDTLADYSYDKAESSKIRLPGYYIKLDDCSEAAKLLGCEDGPVLGEEVYTPLKWLGKNYTKDHPERLAFRILFVPGLSERRALGEDIIALYEKVATLSKSLNTVDEELIKVLDELFEALRHKQWDVRLNHGRVGDALQLASGYRNFSLNCLYGQLGNLKEFSKEMEDYDERN